MEQMTSKEMGTLRSRARADGLSVSNNILADALETLLERGEPSDSILELLRDDSIEWEVQTRFCPSCRDSDKLCDGCMIRGSAISHYRSAIWDKINEKPSRG